MSAAGGALPNLIIAGAPRCGTSALFSYLAAHPEVAGSSVKETQYFMDRDSALFHPDANYLDHGVDGYHRYFTAALEERPEAKVVFEATPGYMYQQTALANLPALASRPKLLFQLRRPARQVYSSYLYSLHQAGNLPREVSFREFALGSDAIAASPNEFHREALRFAEYIWFLDRWRAACGDDRTRVARFEALRDDPRAYMRDLATWLDIDPDFYEGYGFDVVNRNVEIRARGAQGVSRRLARPLSGRSREVARKLYRRFNTRPVAGPSADEQAVMAEIDERTREADEELADRFGIDLRASGTA